MNAQYRYNSERYPDMTCFLALRNIERNERKERSAYSVMNERRFVRPKYCIKKWSWRYSCNGKVEFFTYTRKIKDIIWKGDYDIL